MHDVVIAGVGQTSVGEHWDISLRELAFYAVEAARKDAGELLPQALYLANMLAPPLSHQSHLATLVADFCGLQGIEAASVEAAGASGGAALRMAYLAVASGEVEVAVVVGAEKMSEQTTSNVQAAEATTGDSDYEAEQGLTPTAGAALLMRRYLHEFDPPKYSFGGFPLVAHANGAHNKNAMFRRAIRPELYQRAGMVSSPLNMFDIAPLADGAAAIVLTRSDLLPEKFSHPLVKISGSSSVVDTLALHDRPDPLVFQAARLSVERALAQAGKTRDEVDLFELYDAFSVYGSLSLEAAGFAERGEGWKLVENGKTERLPLLTFGGLKARGNPGGATGVYQAVEASLQLRGQADACQVPDAKVAMIQALGGPASTAVTHILELAG